MPSVTRYIAIIAGKTTLAHVAARHCGYAPMEINASDDRSAKSLSQVLTGGAYRSHLVLRQMLAAESVSVCTFL